MMALNDKEKVKVKKKNVSSNPCQSKINFAWNTYLLLLIFHLEQFFFFFCFNFISIHYPAYCTQKQKKKKNYLR